MSATVSITWWGHATTTIEMAGIRILTDPVLTGRIGHLARIGGPTPRAEALQADVVVVSHMHFDHLHVASLRQLDPDVRIVAPTGTAGALRRAGPRLADRVEEVDPGDVVDIDTVRVRVVPAEHDGRRSPVSAHRGPAVGFVVEAGRKGGVERVWFAGDTGLFDAMARIGPVDAAVVPVSGWGPSLGPMHLDAVQAAEAVVRVGARDAVPIHYGTFWPVGLRHVRPGSFRRYFTDPGTQFAAELSARRPDARAHVLGPGQTVTITGAGA